MTFSIVRLLMIVALCGVSASLVGETYVFSADSKANTWKGNFFTLFAAVFAGLIGMGSNGFGLVMFVLVAVLGGTFNCQGMARMKNWTVKRPILTYICAPIAWVAVWIAILTAAYTLLAIVFSQFPLPVEVPFSAIPDVFSFFLQQPLLTWLIYALAAYLSITGGTVVRNYHRDWLAAWKQRRAAASTNPVATASTNPAPTVKSGVKD